MNEPPAPSPVRALAGAAAIVLLLYLLGSASFIVRVVEAPLVWLATFAHETGHGLAAMLVGARFERLVIFWDASGVATHSGVAADSAARAIVSAGGLLGPAFLAAAFFALGTRPRLARVGLALFGAFMLAIAALFVRNVFGLVFTVGCGALFLLGARKLGPERAQIAMLFVAIQLALSVFSRADYLFTSVARTGAGEMPSDVANVAAALGGPFWLWGLIIGGWSVLVLVGGLGVVWWSSGRATPLR
ncbi:MAG: M50 family metallopeptidase [Deltaproteobacteria bacterium]|nr:M50 family metallopeptidase [Deltaproteobacteria bacterium]